MKSKITAIKATQLYDGIGKGKDKYIVVENGKITEVSTRKRKTDFEGIVTPAFIDPHSHIGMFREGEPGSEQEGNEFLHQILPLSDPLNSVYFDDRAFKDAVDFGVLYSCIMPGSGNLFGGKARVIRNWAKNRAEADYLDYGYKMALGFNPRSTTGWKGDRPNTRMGIYGMLEKRFDDLLLRKRKAELARERKLFDFHSDKAKSKDKKAAKEISRFTQAEYENEFNKEDLAILEVLEGRKPVKIHVHKEDDVIYLIELVKKYGIKASAEHTGDVFNPDIFERLADEDISVTYGPLGSFSYKVELMHSYYQNTELLIKSGVQYGLMSDHPVIHVTCLRDSLKYFLIYGISDEEAISILTYKNAKQLGLEKKLGRVAPGYTASLLVWDNHPLSLRAFPRVVMAEGEILRG